jgi:hypothetical protein
MFGCVAVYVKDKIVLILRDKTVETRDNGVWLATTEDHHASLHREFPNMRSLHVFGGGAPGGRSCQSTRPISKRQLCARASSY